MASVAKVRLTPSPGGEAAVRVQRQLPGKRLGRLTGAGLFAESQRFGEQLDWPESGIVGATVCRRLATGPPLLGLGDTLSPSGPLGLYHSSSATTSAALKQFEPPIRCPRVFPRCRRGSAQRGGDAWQGADCWVGSPACRTSRGRNGWWQPT